ncbi:MAG TPA: 4-(cytidine 5'-diphospho)-2-C-methyl-D-erythritol kinase, partial [Rectinemataceae bacterium]|nr:4-(cytidine 5'-diphospho)-2-C-methyl-D-erythritol kinase [Rectinemataceae bacterium]
SVLRGLDRLFGTALGGELLSRLGAGIGSDVPFFFTEGAALVSGRGEHVEAVRPRRDLALALVFPGFPVSTAEAYGLLDRSRPDDSSEEDLGPEAIEAAYRSDPRTWTFANSFEPWVGAAHPRIPALRDSLLRLGASFAAMSGSGSTVFGVFSDPEACELACRRLGEEGERARSVLPLARLPELH